MSSHSIASEPASTLTVASPMACATHSGHKASAQPNCTESRVPHSKEGKRLSKSKDLTCTGLAVDIKEGIALETSTRTL